MAKVTQLGFIEDDTIGTPPTNIVNIYAKSDKLLYFKNDVGVELPIGTGSGSGSVVSVTSANGDITITNPSTNPVLTVVETPSTRALESATTTVNVDSATAPTAGQVLTATSGTAATWQTPSTSIGPSCSARLSANQTMGISDVEIIEFDDIEWDTDNCFDTSNYEFTPTLAGYYLVSVWIYGTATSVDYVTFLEKNGDIYYLNEGETDHENTLISCFVPMNGTTDSLTVSVTNNSGGTLTILSSATIVGSPTYLTKFQASYIRGL